MTSVRSSRATITHALLPVEEGDLPLTIARADGSGPALVIMPSAFGVGADLEEQMGELAEEASVVVAFDPFFRDDPGVAPYEAMARVLTRIRELEPERAYRYLRAAIGWARGQSSGQPVVLLALCFGAPFALRAAAEGEVAAVVTWHGTGMERHLDRAAEVRCPLRLHFGGVDPFVPLEAVEALRGALAEHGDVLIAVHDGATHGFSHRASPRSYDERAERASMDSLRALIARGSATAGLTCDR